MKDLRAALSRMSQALDLPVEAAWGFGSNAFDQKRLEECVELVEAFQLLGIQARQRCLAFAKAEVQRCLQSEA